jgi:hypothetical protein
VRLCKSNKQSKSSPAAAIFISEEVRNKGIRGWKTGKESLTSSAEEPCAWCRGGGVAAEESCLPPPGEAAGEADHRGGRAAAEEPCSCPVQGRRRQSCAPMRRWLEEECGL